MKLFNRVYNTILENVVGSEPADNQPQGGTENIWTPERVSGLVELVRGSLRQANPYFWHLLKSMPIKIVAPNSEIQTAAVDQYRNLYFNPVFVQQILDHYETGKENKVTGTDPFTYLVAHEIYHVVNRTFERQKGRNIVLVGAGGNQGTLWNVATDFEMNDELSWRWGLTPPTINGRQVGCLTDKDGNAMFNGKKYNFRGKPAERIYNELAKDIPKSDRPGGPDGKPGPGEPDGKPGGPDGKPGPGGKQEIKIGSIVKIKGADSFGEVVDIKNGEAIIKEISKEEAYGRFK